MKLVHETDPISGLAGRARFRDSDWRPAGAALLVAAAYYLGAKIGLALTFSPHPISVLWPPNAVLLAALLLAPVRWWWILLLAAFPAHLVAELQGGVPTAMVFCWFLSNVSEALIGAVCVRRFVRGPLTLDNVHNVLVFFFFAVLLGPFASSFLDAAFVTLIGWGEIGYWALWKTRVFSNILATLTFVPVIVTWATLDVPWMRNLKPARSLEGGILLFGLLAVCIFVFDWRFAASDLPHTLLYLPLPFLLWTALRFGVPGMSAAFMAMAFLAIWGAGHGRGPFSGIAPSETALAVQLFLISVAIPMLFLAAVMEERRNTERKLRRSEKRFSTAFRSSPDAIAITRLSDEKIIEVNDRWQAMFGYLAQEVIGRPMPELNVYESGDGRDRMLDPGKTRSRARDLEVACRTRTGAAVQTLISTETVEMEGELCSIAIIRDITEQRRAEVEAREQHRQLTHLTRIVTLSDFSGALAHELKQPLTAILCNAQAAQRFLAHDPLDVSEIRSILYDIVEADKRAGEVIRRLRVLLKKGDGQFAPIDVNELLTEVLEFAHSDFVTRNMTVTTRFAAELSPVSGDRVQLQQLFLNLVSNASDSMDGNDRSERKLTVVTNRDNDATLRVIVSDRGTGVMPDQLERLFEPFFTTKENGLGLGLSICRTIAAAHGGRLWAENNPGRGAAFHVTLPIQAG